MEGEDLGAKEVNEQRLEDQKGGSHAATVPGRVGPSHLALVAPFDRSFAQKHPRELKMPI